MLDIARALGQKMCLSGTQDDDMEEEDSDVEDSCGDGFVVPNGYISEDEGVGSVQQDLDELCAELDGEHLAGADWKLHLVCVPKWPLIIY